MDHDSICKELGKVLRRARLRGGKTQEELAAALGASVQTISNIERGKTTPSLKTLLEIADEVKADLSAIFGSLQRVEASPHRISIETELLEHSRAMSEDELVKLVRIAAVFSEQ